MANGRPSPVQKSTAREVTIGKHTGMYDPAMVDSEMVKTLSDANNTYSPWQGVGNMVSQARAGVAHMGQAFGRLLGNRPTTPAEEEQYKQRGQKAFYDAKYQRSLEKK